MQQSAPTRVDSANSTSQAQPASTNSAPASSMATTDLEKGTVEVMTKPPHSKRTQARAVLSNTLRFLGANVALWFSGLAPMAGFYVPLRMAGPVAPETEKGFRCVGVGLGSLLVLIFWLATLQFWWIIAGGKAEGMTWAKARAGLKSCTLVLMGAMGLLTVVMVVIQIICVAVLAATGRL